MKAGRWLLVPVAALAVGCAQEMANQERLDPFEASEFFEDGRASRPPVEGTVARGQLRVDEHLYRGTVDGELAATFPFEVTRDVLLRGHERYDIFCAPCHDRAGQGNGIVVQRGFRRPSSFHLPRLRDAPPGYYFDVMTAGFGAMQSVATQVPVRDRWAIVAYIRALQYSQNAPMDELPQVDRAELEGR